jgi:hypothetical protein
LLINLGPVCEALKIQGSAKTTVKTSKVHLYPRIDAAVPQNHPIESIDKVSVTPSLNHMPSVSAASNLTPVDSRAQHSKLVPMTMSTTRNHGSQQQPNCSSTHASSRNLIQPSRDDAQPAPRQFQWTHQGPPACRHDHDLQHFDRNPGERVH